jgi:predicted DNA-binding transcriptional regulator AlpA
MKDVIVEKRLLNVKEAAHYLGLSPRTLYNRVAPRSSNPFPVRPRRLGRKVVFDAKELEKFVAEL